MSNFINGIRSIRQVGGYGWPRRRPCHLSAIHTLDTASEINDETEATVNQRRHASRFKHSNIHSNLIVANTDIHNFPLYDGIGNKRSISSLSEITSIMPEIPSIWGGTGFILKSLNHDGLIPYWACISLTGVIVRTSMVPLVIKGAKTAARYATAAPEVQFVIASFQKDLRTLTDKKASPVEIAAGIRYNWQSLKKIWSLYQVNPLDLFKSPLCQIPVYMYFSIDLRKTINGGDPALAQDLADTSFLWVPNLTEPDPMYGLPIIAGMLLYANVEIAIGKKSLSGESASQSNIALYLKDFFQSLAVFMPCFMSQSPSGVQIYLMTSFVFTATQSVILRYDPFREMVGLPKMSVVHKKATLVEGFMEFKNKGEKAAAAARGYGGVLGASSVLYPGYSISFAGSNRRSSISYNNDDIVTMEEFRVNPLLNEVPVPNNDSDIPASIRAIPQGNTDEIEEQAMKQFNNTMSNEMVAANRGERISPLQFAAQKDKDENIFSTKKLKSKKKRKRPTKRKR